MTDYERGSLAGFAEGVEAAEAACQAEEASRSSYVGRAALNRASRRILALLPSALGRMAPGVEGEPASGYGLHPSIVVTPHPGQGDHLKLIVTVGLPRSGKSTWAKTTGWPIVNPDAIRLAIHGQRFYGPAEPLVWATAHVMVEALRLAGHKRIVLDATNVTAKRRDEWERQYAGAVEFYPVLTSPEECIRRAQAEGDVAIIPVIERMAREWDYPEKWGRTPDKEGTK